MKKAPDSVTGAAMEYALREAKFGAAPFIHDCRHLASQDSEAYGSYCR